MSAKNWLSVYQYCKKHNVSKQTIYLRIRLGKLPPEKYRTAKIEVTRLQILDEE